MLTPPTVDLPDPVPGDERLGHLLGRRSGDTPAAVLVGFPSDEGVRRNGGRLGAAAAPAPIRERLYRLTPDARPERADAFRHLVERTVDLGDVDVTGDVDADQQRLGEVLAPYLRDEVFVIVLGGGHETSYGHFLGYIQAERPVALVNWDAHPDVRPLKASGAHSGSPFRQALEHPAGNCRGYSVAGLQPHSTAPEHAAYLHGRGAEIVWRDAVTPSRIDAVYGGLDGAACVSFDMDAVDQAYAPGVSAPASNGLTPALWLRAAYGAGRSGQVRSVDLVEVNPRFDRDGQTVRLAALTVWTVLSGLAERRSRDL